MSKKETKSTKSKRTGSEKEDIETDQNRAEVEGVKEDSYVWKDVLKCLAFFEGIMAVSLTIIMVGSLSLMGYAVYNYQLNELIRTSHFWAPYNIVSCLLALITSGIGLAAFAPSPPKKFLAQAYSVVLAFLTVLLCFWFGYFLMYSVGCTLKLINFPVTGVAGCFDKRFSGKGAIVVKSKYTHDDNYFVNLGIIIFEWIKMFVWLVLIGINLVSFISLLYNWKQLKMRNVLKVMTPETSPGTSTVTSPQTSQAE